MVMFGAALNLGPPKEGCQQFSRTACGHEGWTSEYAEGLTLELHMCLPYLSTTNPSSNHKGFALDSVGPVTLHMQALLSILNRIYWVHHQGSTLNTIGPAPIQKL
jgi:hypothetical protein